MSAFAEFAGVAIALYLWESILWVPLRGIALRRRGKGRWRVLDPSAVFSTRELGLVPMLPLLPDAGLAPCQPPPLLATIDGSFLIERGSHLQNVHKQLTWNDLRVESHHLIAAEVKIRVSSKRCVETLKRAKRRGATPEVAVYQAWRMALSLGRAGREWRRWNLVSGPLRWYQALLTMGFFAGLPLTYVFLGTLPTLLLALWLWSLMAWTAGHLWWLGKRVYPDARSSFRMDALLALVVPFHAMRALEIASVHAMATTHPVGLILATGDFENPWLAGFVRRVLLPLPDSPEDKGFSATLQPMLAKALGLCGKHLEDFDVEPDRSDDEAAAKYCPRCHGLFLEKVLQCPDCRGVGLRPFV